MTNSSSNSKPKPSQTASSEAAASTSQTTSPSTKRQPNALTVLVQELRGAEQDAPISVRQALVLVASIVNIQNVVVSVMDTMDANQDIANKNSEYITANFIAMANAVKQIGEVVGVTVKTAVEVAEEAEADDLKVPDGVTIQ